VQFCSRHQPARLVRLEPGHVLLPGFVDPHSHLLGTGRNLMLCSLAGCADVAELQDRLRAWIASHEGEKLVLGVSYDDTKLREMRHPTRSELDSVSAGAMIVIQHVSGHVGVANTAGMALATEHPDLISKSQVLERIR
jgi:predicted amidohydrolase YtcJ